MLIQRISRSDPERVFIVVRADEASCGKGEPACWAADNTRNGIDVLEADATADAGLICGMFHTDIANGDYGLVQCYGYDDDVVVQQSTVTYARGGVLGFYTASNGYSLVSASVPAGNTVLPEVVAMSALATSTTSAMTTLPCFIRFM